MRSESRASSSRRSIPAEARASASSVVSVSLAGPEPPGPGTGGGSMEFPGVFADIGEPATVDGVWRWGEGKERVDGVVGRRESVLSLGRLAAGKPPGVFGCCCDMIEVVITSVLELG